MTVEVMGDLVDRRTMRATEILRNSSAVAIGMCLVLSCVVLALPSVVAQTISPQSAASSAQAKAVGQIKSIDGSALTLMTDDGKSVSISLPEAARILRIEPGKTDLKSATPITAQELQTGDRILVRGKASEDSKTIAASTVIVMKQSDLAARQQQEREDWQKRGIGGLVSEVDPTAGTVTISVTTFSGSKKVVVQTTKKTAVRRYAQNSVKFDDAKPSTLAEIHPGDQLRARGKKNADGTEFAAEEIVSGAFRNIAGTVTSVDMANNSLTVMDLLTKKAVMVKVTPDSQLRKLPAMMAQRIAMRLKGPATEGQPPPGAPAGVPGARSAGAPPQGTSGGLGGAGGGAARGGGDLQQILSRLPTMTVNDFQKGDAVILVSTEGTGSEVTAINLVGGVEPILTAAPAGGQAMVLSPWSLSGAPGEASAQ
jgi:co-chaperonin GroES (HSP10)